MWCSAMLIPETTLKYTHPADAMAREAAETLGDLLGG